MNNLLISKKKYTMLNSKGFSMVELIIVIAIVAILAVSAIPIYNNITQRAEYSALLANVSIYKDAAQAAMVDLGIPEDTVIWGDDTIEGDEWEENTWIVDEIEDGILVMITNSGHIEISFVEGSSNYTKYTHLIEKYGEINKEF